MELDEFKQAWRQADDQQTNTQNIMKMIHLKSKGPIASLQTTLRKQMAAVTVLMTVVIATNAKNVDSVSANFLFWTYIGFCLALIGSLQYNFRLTRKMQMMNGSVKSHLEQHIEQLEKSLIWQAIGARVVILFFILLLEVIPHFQHLRMVDTWHSLSPLVRFSAYGGYLLFQYFLSKAIRKKKFGTHLNYLKDLVREV